MGEQETTYIPPTLKCIFCGNEQTNYYGISPKGITMSLFCEKCGALQIYKRISGKSINEFKLEITETTDLESED